MILISNQDFFFTEKIIKIKFLRNIKIELYNYISLELNNY